MEVSGTLKITGPSAVTINASVEIKSGGQLIISSKLNLGTSSGCGYTLVARTGSIIDVSTGSDRLLICGTDLLKGATSSCNDCGGTYSGQCAYAPTNKPYCEPPSGNFSGPLGFDQNGGNAALPIKLQYFNVSIPKKENHAVLEWATSMEENFEHFEIQRAGKDLEFATIVEVPGVGYTTNSVQEYSAYDENPLVVI